MNHEKYLEYSVEELYEALDTVDLVQFPEQMERIESRINELEGSTTLIKIKPLEVKVSELPKSLKIAFALVVVHWIVYVVWFGASLTQDLENYKWGMHILFFPMVFKIIKVVRAKSYWLLSAYSIGFSVIWSYKLFVALKSLWMGIRSFQCYALYGGNFFSFICWSFGFI